MNSNQKIPLSNKRKIDFTHDPESKKQIRLFNGEAVFADGNKRVTPLRLNMDGGSGSSDSGGFGGIFGGGDSSFNDPTYWSDGH